MPFRVRFLVTVKFLDNYGDYTELLKQTQGIPIYPSLHDLSPGKLGERHTRDPNFLARGGDDAQRPLMRAGARPAASHGVTFGGHVLDCKLKVWECRTIEHYSLLFALRALSKLKC